MPLTESLKKAQANTPSHRAKEPLWKGPEQDGVTFSMLSRFLVCRERFRLYAIEGLRTADNFNHRIEYGQMWHVCEESFAKPRTPAQVDESWLFHLRGYVLDLVKRYRLQQEQINHWYNVCKVQFPEYVQYWAKHPDVIQRTPLLQEQVFDVPYKLSSGRTVRLRGKWDSVDHIGVGKSSGVYLQENKTKGDIREDQIKRQLTFDLQTMMYLTALQASYIPSKHKKPIMELHHTVNGYKGTCNAPLLGIRYNVVRRPSSGGKGDVRQGKNETLEQFCQRLSQALKDRPGDFFMRWKAEVTPGDISKFRRECLDPILEQLCRWWEAVKYATQFELKMEHFTQSDDHDAFSQWSGIHWRHPFGVWNALDEGGSSDLDEYLATGSEVGLQRVDSLFTELT